MMGPGGAGRQSMYPQPNNPANIMFGGPSSSANQARLISKQAELEGLRALKDQSAKMVKELERLAEKVDIMADGGDCKYRRIQKPSTSINAEEQLTPFTLGFVRPCLCYSNRIGHGLMAGRLPRNSNRSR